MKRKHIIGLILLYIILTAAAIVLSVFIKDSDAPLIVSLSAIGICSIILAASSRSENDDGDDDDNNKK